MNVNTILPGVIATPINQEMLADEAISQLYQEIIPNSIEMSWQT